MNSPRPLRTAADYSARRISDRFLPNAIDLVNEALCLTKSNVECRNNIEDEMREKTEEVELRNFLTASESWNDTAASAWHALPLPLDKRRLCNCVTSPDRRDESLTSDESPFDAPAWRHFLVQIR